MNNIVICAFNLFRYVSSFIARSFNVICTCYSLHTVPLFSRSRNYILNAFMDLGL